MLFKKIIPRFDRSENFFYKNRSRFLVLYISIIAVLAIIVFYATVQYINIEEKHSSEINCEYVQNICDTTLESIEYKLYQLAADIDISSYFGNMTNESFSITKNAVIKALNAITSGERYLTSAYLYNSFTDTVLYAQKTYTLNDENDDFTDTGWYEAFEKMEHNESLCFERKRPYTDDYYLTIIRKIDKKTIKGGIILNVDISRFMEIAKGNYKYTVATKDDEILYSSDSVAAKLIGDTGLKSYDGKHYSVSSMKSDFSNWVYYVANPLENYTTKLFIIFLIICIGGGVFVLLGVMIASYLAFQSYKPIINIAMLLKNPADSVSREYLENDVNTKFIAERIMYVVNSNEKLKNQLNTQNELFDSAQITALQTQINPHFIYNTLTLFYLTAQDALGKNHALSSGLISLSRIMRYCLSSDNSIVNIKEEIESTNEYLNIMKSRYQNRFEVYWDIDESCVDKKIVKMTMQPILENIFKYAFKKEKKDGIISIKIYKNEQNIVISIKDNGLGIKPEKLYQIRQKLQNGSYNMSRHIGLTNVDKRIKIIYGDNYGITVFSTLDVGTEVVMTFPDQMD